MRSQKNKANIEIEFSSISDDFSYDLCMDGKSVSKLTVSRDFVNYSSDILMAYFVYIVGPSKLIELKKMQNSLNHFSSAITKNINAIEQYEITKK